MSAEAGVLLLGGPLDTVVVTREATERNSDGQDGRFWVRDGHALAFYALTGGNIAKHVKTLNLRTGRSDHDYMIDLLLLDVDWDLRSEGWGGIDWLTPDSLGWPAW